LPAALAPYLRLVAAGAQVHVGEQVYGGPWHVELLVGRCSAAYAGRVVERASQMGLDPERDIILLRGCPPAPQKVLAAFSQLEAAVAAHLAQPDMEPTRALP
jgi:Ni,Fe-hydrogenase III small subunit